MAIQKRNQQAHHDWAKSHQQQLHQLGIMVNKSTETIISNTGSYKGDRGLIAANESTSPASHSEAFPANKLQQKPRKLHGKSNKISSFKVRLHTPKWLFSVSRAIEIYESRANGAWSFNIQVYNVIPPFAPVLHMIRNDDIEGIQSLFSTRQALPFDCTVDGWTLLDEAAFSQNLRICQFLRNESSDPNVSYHSSALVAACESIDAFNHCKRFKGIVGIFVRDTELQDPFEDDASESVWRNWRGDSHTFSWMLQIASPRYQLRSVEERVLFALRVCRTNYQYDIARLIRVILVGLEINEQVCSIKDHEDGLRNTLLHLTASNLGELLMNVLAEQEATVKELLCLITELVIGGSDLHDTDSSGMTPMRDMFLAFCSQYHQRPADHPGLDTLSNITERWNKPLSVWLRLLQDAGIDLVRYGQEENQILQRKCTRREESYDGYFKVSDGWYARTHRLRLINFMYGPEPEDWKFWLAPVMRTDFLEFWDMVDHPERAMPGAWEDEYYSCDWSYYNNSYDN